ncbi:Histone transcription regulator 3 [Thoreauomyces humboldtii]|nr:Histone transcription regulator 3 [Thoreauomyces humboldtii]
MNFRFKVLNPLNEPIQEVDDHSKIDRALDVYLEALQHIKCHRLNDAKRLLTELLDRDALKHALPVAIEVDPSDAVVWCKVGETAAKHQQWDVSLHAFSCGKDIAKLRMLRFRCIAGMVEALYEIAEFPACLEQIKEALSLNPDYPRGIWLTELLAAPDTGVRIPSVSPFDRGSPSPFHADGSPWDSAVARPRQATPCGSTNTPQPPSNLTLLYASFLGLGNLLTDMYRKSTSAGRSNAPESSFQIRIVLELAQPDNSFDGDDAAAQTPLQQSPVKEVTLVVEEVADAQPDGAVPESVQEEGIPEETERSARKRRNSESEDSRRISKRVRHRIEQELQQKDEEEKLLQDLIDPYLPEGYSVCPGVHSICAQRPAPLVPDVEALLSAFVPKILSTSSAPMTRKPKCSELLCDMWLSQSRGGTSSVELPHEFETEDEEDGSTELNPLTQWSISQVLQRMMDVVAEGVFAFKQADKESNVFCIRYHWLKGRIYEQLRNEQRAQWHYKDCRERILAKDADEMVGEGADTALTFVNCLRDEVLSLQTLEGKFAASEARLYVLDAGAKFEEEDYPAVIERLKPVFIVPSDSVGLSQSDVLPIETSVAAAVTIAREFLLTSCPFNKRYKLLDALRQACSRTEDCATAFVCTVHILCDAVSHLVTEHDFEAHLELCAESLLQCIQFVEAQTESDVTWRTLLQAQMAHTQAGASGDGTLFDQLVSAVFLSIRLIWTYMKHHNDVPNASRKPNVARRLKALNVLSVRTWVLFYHVVCVLPEPAKAKEHAMLSKEIDVQGSADLEPGPGETFEIPHAEASLPVMTKAKRLDLPPARDNLAEFLIFGHQELGKRCLCGLDDGRFLKLALSHLTTASGSEYRAEVYQCYYCLYGIKVDHGLEIAEHQSPTSEFDQSAALDVFRSVSEFIGQSLALRGSRGIPADMKQCLDKVTAVFSKPPWENAKVRFNKNAIEGYLSRPISVMEAIPNHQQQRLVWLPFSDSERSKIPDVYFSLFHLQARLGLAQYKARSSVHTYGHFPKTIEVLTGAAEQFLFDLHLSPSRLDSWLQLASCYSSLVNEYLTHSAPIIIASFSEIRDWQKRAFHCFVQAMQLAGRSPTASDLSSRLWGDFGFLCYGIATNPMNGAAAESNLHQIRSFWNSRLEASADVPMAVNIADPTLQPTPVASPEQQKSTKEQTREEVLRLAGFCFKKARSVSRTDWRYPYMLANVYAKLHRPAAVIIKLYRAAVKLVPMDWSTKEQERIVDPAAKLIAYLAKNLHRNIISVEDARLAIKGVADSPGIRDGSLAPASEVDVSARSSSDMRREVFEIFSKLLVRMANLNSWQHKPTFTRAWIAHYEFRNPVQAKDILGTVFKLKEEKSKKLVNFWKSEFERPGKHFMSVHRYILEMATIMCESGDVDGLRILCRKVRKSGDLLLWPDRIWRAVYTACFKALQATAHGTATVSLSGTMSRSDFEDRAPAVEYQMFAAADPKPVRLQNLLCAFELQKLNEGFMDEEELDLFLVETYSSLFAEFERSAGLTPSQQPIDTPATPNAATPDASDSDVGRVRDSNRLLPATPPGAPFPPEKVRFLHVLQRCQYVCRHPPQIARSSRSEPLPAADTDLGIEEVEGMVEVDAGTKEEDTAVDVRVDVPSLSEEPVGSDANPSAGMEE